MGTFLDILLAFINKIFAYDFIPGLSVFSLLFYPFVVVLVFATFTRKG